MADGKEHPAGRELARCVATLCCRAARRIRRPCRCRVTSSSVLFHSILIFGFCSARSCMIMLARSLSRRWTMWTVDAYFVRYVASSTAESPPPTTTSGLLRNRGRAPSQTAQALTPRFLKASSEGRPKVIRLRAGGHDQRVGLVRLALERLDDERPALEIDFDHVVGHHARAKIDRLLPHQLHQLRPGHGVLAFVEVHDTATRSGVDRRFEERLQIAGREAGVVLHLGRERQLAERQRAARRFSSVIAPSNTSG